MENKSLISFGLGKENYKWLLIGLAINILGFILMIGGGSPDKTQFLPEEIFSHRRITLAPALVVLGYIVILYAIMKKSKSAPKEN
jgi:ABC-type molybdate transport system permease subunit